MRFVLSKPWSRCRLADCAGSNPLLIMRSTSQLAFSRTKTQDSPSEQSAGKIFDQDRPYTCFHYMKTLQQKWKSMP